MTGQVMTRETSRQSRHALRVLYVTACGEGGVAKYIRTLAESLDALGMKVVVLGPQRSRLAEAISGLPDVEFIGLPLSRRPSPSDFLCISELRRIIREGAFDIVHTNGSKAGVLVAAAACGLGVKLVYSPHGVVAHLAAVTPLAPLYSAMERWAARKHDLVIVVCEAERLEAEKSGISRDGRALVIYNGLSKFSDPPSSDFFRRSLGLCGVYPVVGTACRLNRGKGIEYLIRAFRRVAESFPDAELLIAGDGPMETQLREIARAELVEDRVHFVGHLTDVASFLCELDVFVHPSKWEAFPFVLLESGLAGVPVVATDVGGTGELIDDSTGWLVPANDVEALNAATVEALSDKSEALGRARMLGQRVTEQFNSKVMVERTLEAYYSMIANIGPSPESRLKHC